MSEPRSSEGPLRLVILMPVYSDWAIASLVCQKLDEQIAALEGVEVRLLLVDDGSPESFSGWSPFEAAHITCIDALVLRRNMGHQRAIAMGLCWIEEEMECDAVVVMDADGEDRPEDVRRLVNSFREHPQWITFAERGKRFETHADAEVRGSPEETYCDQREVGFEFRMLPQFLE